MECGQPCPRPSARGRLYHMAGRTAWSAASGVMVSLASAALSESVVAQPVARPGPSGTVQLNFADEITLDQLADYVGSRVGGNIIYDQQALTKKVVIKAPVPVPSNALLSLLDSALQIHGLALVSSGDGSWKTVVAATDLAGVAEPLPLPGGSREEATGRN